ncbi:MAG: hypothetical protein ACREXT_18025 [Gammaproteobacteria bacterium]
MAWQIKIMPFRYRPMSTRALLRAFQRVRDRLGADPAATEGFKEELALLQHKDLDLSVRLGALLAFNALLLTAAINPISASPGAPISLNAAQQPWEVITVLTGIALLATSALLCVRGIMLGEEFSTEGIEDDPRAIVQRMFAAYCASVDAQARFLSLGSRFTIAGGAVSAIGFVWIIVEKILS